MKSEPKAFASLSSGLLARKGAAKPAMRPQGFGQGGSSLEDLGWNDMGFEPPRPATVLRDATHDAFGDDIPDRPAVNPASGLTPIDSPVHNQQAAIADRFVPVNEDEDEVDETAELVEFEAPAEPVAPVVAIAPAPAPAPRRSVSPRAAPGSKAKAAFTLRLDPERHLKLRLACAVRGRSAQLIVTDALDALLASMPELDAMAAKAERKG